MSNYPARALGDFLRPSTPPIPCCLVPSSDHRRPFLLSAPSGYVLVSFIARRLREAGMLDLAAWRMALQHLSAEHLPGHGRELVQLARVAPLLSRWSASARGLGARRPPVTTWHVFAGSLHRTVCARETSRRVGCYGYRRRSCHRPGRRCTCSTTPRSSAVRQGRRPTRAPHVHLDGRCCARERRDELRGHGGLVSNS